VAAYNTIGVPFIRVQSVSEARASERAREKIDTRYFSGALPNGRASDTISRGCNQKRKVLTYSLNERPYPKQILQTTNGAAAPMVI